MAASKRAPRNLELFIFEGKLARFNPVRGRPLCSAVIPPQNHRGGRQIKDFRAGRCEYGRVLRCRPGIVSIDSCRGTPVSGGWRVATLDRGARLAGAGGAANGLSGKRDGDFPGERCDFEHSVKFALRAGTEDQREFFALAWLENGAWYGCRKRGFHRHADWGEAAAFVFKGELFMCRRGDLHRLKMNFLAIDLEDRRNGRSLDADSEGFCG